MEKETINLKLPLIKVNIGDPWRATDFVKEHFPTGCFIVDDGVQCYLTSNDGSGYICDICIARELVVDALVEDTRQAEFMKSLDIIDEIENRLEQIARLARESKEEVVKSETRVMDELSAQRDAAAHEFTLVMEGMKGLHDTIGKSSGSGVNPIDLAKTFAVIQKPELIEKL